MGFRFRLGKGLWIRILPAAISSKIKRNGICVDVVLSRTTGRHAFPADDACRSKP